MAYTCNFTPICCASPFRTAPCRRASCASSPRSPANTTVATGTSRPGRTFNSTGSSSPNCRMRWRSLPASACTACRPVATTSAISRPINGRASRPRRLRILAWAELIRQHVTLHPEFSFMPRKFKIAVGASRRDRAALRIHDMALRLHRDASGKTGFEVMVGGGLGRTPYLAQTIKPFLEKRDALSYVEAVLRTYNQFGRRDNIWKARIKILVHDLGAEAFAKEVDVEWQGIKDGRLALDPAVVADVASRFVYPAYQSLADSPGELAQARRADRRFDAWVGN